MKKFALVLFLSLAISSHVFAQTFSAETNRREIPTGELFVLSLTYQGEPTNSEPDLSPLEKGFTIYSASSSVSTISTNGKMITTTKWDISLISDKTDGEIKIPSIKFGDLTSKPLTIKINNNQTPSQTEDKQNENNVPKYSIHTKIDNKEPFVQQQIRYSIIVEDAGNLQLAAPHFAEGIKNEWFIKPLSNPVVSTKTEAGKTVREIRYDYAIFPQKSGELTLPQVMIDGHYLTPGKKNASKVFDSFLQSEFGDLSNVLPDVFAQKNPIMLRNKPETINVKQIPNISGMSWWLPAKDVKITSKWETPASEFRVGEAISRTIEIKTVGTIDAQIPNISFAQIDGIKQYPEKAVLNSSVVDGNIVSTAQISNVYIPTKAGKFEIPTIEIVWFNTKTNQIKKAFLDNVEINIKENGSYISEESVENFPIYNQSLNTIKNIPDTGSVKAINYLGIAAAFLVGMLVGLFIFKNKKNRLKEENKTIKENYKKNIVLAAQKSDFKLLRDELIKWATDRYKDDKILNLKDINKHIKNKDFEKALDTISANLYSNNKLNWNSKKFIDTFENVCSNRVIISKSSSILPELYK